MNFVFPLKMFSLTSTCRIFYLTFNWVHKQMACMKKYDLGQECFIKFFRAIHFHCKNKMRTHI